jgi:hypothetical protein
MSKDKNNQDLLDGDYVYLYFNDLEKEIYK